MRIPVATYRLQFTPDFGFDAATAIAPYLAELGVSDIYASPILEQPNHVVVMLQERTMAEKIDLQDAPSGKTLHFDAAQLLEHAREGLISGVHHAWLACTLIICFAIILALRLPHFALHAPDKSHTDQ